MKITYKHEGKEVASWHGESVPRVGDTLNGALVSRVSWEVIPESGFDSYYQAVCFDEVVHVVVETGKL